MRRTATTLPRTATARVPVTAVSPIAGYSQPQPTPGVATGGYGGVTTKHFDDGTNGPATAVGNSSQVVVSRP